MPPKISKPNKKIVITAGQGSIQLFFQNKPQTVAETAVPLLETQISTQSTDPRVSAFMASLTPSERIAHTIALEKLGTSYDIVRTHGFVRWSSRA